MFLCRYEKGLLNFVSERIKLVYRVNNTRLAFQTSKTTIYRPQTSELKSISKFKLLFHWKNFKKLIIIWTFILYLEAGWKRTHKLWNTCVVPFAIAELGQMSWSSTHTKIWTRQQLHHCTQHLNHEDNYFNAMLLNTFSSNKRSKNCEESKWRSLIKCPCLTLTNIIKS